jgi:hypothetical protein
MKRALLFLTAGFLSLLLFGSLAGCGDRNLAPTSNNDQMKSEVKAEVGSIQPSAASPAPAAENEGEEEEKEEDQFGR